MCDRSTAQQQKEKMTKEKEQTKKKTKYCPIRFKFNLHDDNLRCAQKINSLIIADVSAFISRQEDVNLK